MSAAGPRRFRVGLATFLLGPSILSALAVAVLVVLPTLDEDAPARSAARADRAALEALVPIIALLPPERRAPAVQALERGFGGRLRLVGPGLAPPPAAGGEALPWRVPAGGLAEARDGEAGWIAVAGAPLPGAARGTGLVSSVARPHSPSPLADTGFVVTLGLAFIALSLLPAIVLSRRLAADLRRIERGLTGLAAADGTDVAEAPQDEPRRLPEADDELGLVAWTYESVRDRFHEDLQRYGKARARLARLDQDKIDFLAVMSHELRTPLNTILGFSEVLLEGLEGPVAPGQREDLRIIRESGDHLLGLVNDILDLSALQAGQLRGDFVETDLVDIARAVLDEAEGQLREKPVRLVAQFDRERLPLRGDQRLLRRVLQNLVGNALKFTQRGEVRLALRCEGTEDVVVVSDTGPGIAADALAAIFEEYRQTGDARAKREGTGLGLAIVRRLAEMHGGSVTATSKLGTGSTFTVRLPIAGPPAGGEGG